MDNVLIIKIISFCRIEVSCLLVTMMIHTYAEFSYKIILNTDGILAL
jgi:hypothetical protein